MWRHKKLLIGAVLTVVILAGSIGGVVLADNGDDGPAVKIAALWDRVRAIYQDNTGVAIDQEALKDAFVQAQNEMRIETMKMRLQSLVDEGRITQEQADEYLEWQQSRPDVPLKFGFKGHGKFRGNGGMRGFGGLCAPTQIN